MTIKLEIKNFTTKNKIIDSLCSPHSSIQQVDDLIDLLFRHIRTIRLRFGQRYSRITTSNHLKLRKEYIYKKSI